MKKLALVGALAVAACTPEVPKTEAVAHPIVAFDPAAAVPVVPTPNDLAIDPTTGKVNAPIDPSTSAANQEFTRDYLNTLDGFPPGTTAESTPVMGGDLDPASVTPASVIVNDLTAAAMGQDPSVAATIAYDAETKQIAITPPDGAWIKGHKYDVALVSGEGTGLKMADGSQVLASPVWALARSADPLVSCTADNVCTSTTSAISDPAQAQQLEQLRAGYEPILDQLEANGVPRSAVALLWTFTITSQPELRFDPTASVIPFPNDLATDPTTGKVNLPLPTLPDGGTDTTSLQAQLIGGLNTLDGFSTTAPIVSENSEDGAALDQGKIDPASISAATVGFFPLSTPATVPDVKVCLLPDMPGCASTTTQADGSYALPDGGTVPQQLQLIPQVPLDEKTSYGTFITTDLKSTDGKNVAPATAFALFRLKNPVFVDGHSTVNGVSDEQAAQIEPARAALEPFFDALEAQQIPRSKLAMAWTFHTQSEQSILYQLAQAPAANDVPVSPLGLGPASELLTCGGTCPYPVDKLAAAFKGNIISPFLLTGQGGTLNPAAPLVHTIPFILTLPSGTKPATGWPVVIFGHGLSGNRTQAMAIANSLAQGGFAMIAIDEVWHGERISCTGLGNFAASLAGVPAGSFNDNIACAGGSVCDEGFPIGRCVAGPETTTYGSACVFPAMEDGSNGDAYCQSLGEGNCRPTADGQPGPSQCDGADWNRDASGQPYAVIGALHKNVSGWNLFNLANLFATRDNFRQQVIDDAQLARVVVGIGPGQPDLNGQLQVALSSASPLVDGTQIHYVGQSLGGILGTLYTSADPTIHKTLLNVPAGDLLGVFMNTPDPTLGALRTGFISTLASQGIAFGTPGFDNFLGIGKWILDPADPVNAGHSLWNGPGAPDDRQAFIQFIENDQILPNSTTEELIAATIRTNMGEETCSADPTPPCADVFEFTEADFGAIMPVNPAAPPAGCGTSDPQDPCNERNRHGFLLNGVSPTLTGFGQQQAVQFLATGTIKTTFP